MTQQTIPDERKEKKMKTDRPVLVTTEHKGVFFGYTSDKTGPRVTLRNARMCVYWSTDLRGVLGLAVRGPSKTCKVSPAADIVLEGVTMICEVQPTAVKAWEDAPWAA